MQIVELLLWLLLLQWFLLWLNLNYSDQQRYFIAKDVSLHSRTDTIQLLHPFHTGIIIHTSYYLLTANYMK